MLSCTIEDPVTDWVIDHPETEAVFQEMGIDYHCGGKSLEYACREQGLDVQRVLGIVRGTIALARGDDERS